MTQGKTRVFGIDIVKSVVGAVVDYGVTIHLYCEIFDLSVSRVQATI